MLSIRAYLKLILFLLMLVSYFICTFPFYIIAKKFRYRARKVISVILRVHCIFALKIFGVKCHLKGDLEELRASFQGLIVSNHLSYIDIIVIASIIPTCFVTSVEMKNAPFLGQLCEAGGCLYVERRSRESLKEEIKDITDALISGLNVVVFPEATSTDGADVKRFKRPLFQASIDAAKSVLPLTLNYKSIEKKAIDSKNRGYVFWYGDMDFAPHFWSFLQQKKIEIELIIGETIESFSQTPQDLAALSHQRVCDSYRKIEHSALKESFYS